MKESTRRKRPGKSWLWRKNGREGGAVGEHRVNLFTSAFWYLLHVGIIDIY